MKRTAVPAALIIMSILLANCGGDRAGDGGPAGIFLPTYEPGPASPTGIAEGILTQRDNCLFLETRNGDPFLLLWPEGYSAVKDNGHTLVLDGSGLPVGVVGVALSVGGGERDLKSAADIVGQEIPQECQGKFYWLVSGPVD